MSNKFSVLHINGEVDNFEIFCAVLDGGSFGWLYKKNGGKTNQLPNMYASRKEVIESLAGHGIVKYEKSL